MSVNDRIVLLLRLGDVYHVTLDSSGSEIQRRAASRGGDQTPEWLLDHIRWIE